MNTWLSIPDSTKINAYEQTAEAKGMNAFAVEKDWWVTQTLAIIFEMNIAKYLVFKGGTSLSKAWGLIQRFSEDIDLVIDRDYFGFDGNLSKHQITDLRKKASAFTSGEFFEELQKCFESKGFNNLKFNIVSAKDTDQDPRIIEVFYPNVIPQTGYLLPKVQIEMGCRSLREPFSVRTFGSFLDEHYTGKEFSSPFIKIPTVNPERTFLEKIFLLHEEFHRPFIKIRDDRLSRHLYDIFHLLKTDYAINALNDRELYETIVAHRYKFARVGGVNYNQHNPKTINPIPVADVMKAWEEDYMKMRTDMIYEKNPPTFNMLIESLNELKKILNNLNWEFSLVFPIAK